MCKSAQYQSLCKYKSEPWGQLQVATVCFMQPSGHKDCVQAWQAACHWSLLTSVSTFMLVHVCDGYHILGVKYDHYVIDTHTVGILK